MEYDGSLKFDTSIDTKGFTSGLSTLGNLAKSMLSTLTNIATTAVVAVTTGLTTSATAATKVGMEFEAAMSKVSAISGATGDDLQSLTDKAKELGASTQFSAIESAQAFQYMAMAGWSTEQMLGGVDGIMNLAAADGLDLATTSDIVTDALTAFGLSAKDSTHFADVLATASSSANTNVSMLGESFKYVAPLAGTMGYSVEDVSLALGLMANASVKGGQAGTSLRMALANLAAPSESIKSKMDELGISMTDSEGNALSLREIIIQLREKFGDLSETEQSAAASTIFGKEAMSGMLAIINASDEDFQNLINNIDNADGAAERMADTLNDNLNGDITIMKSALEGFGITIYESIAGKLREAVQLGTEYIDRLSQAFTDGGLEGAVAEAGEIFGELTAKIADYAPDMIEAAINFIKSFVQGIVDNQEQVLSAVKEVIGIVGRTLLELLPSSIRYPITKVVENLEETLGSVPSVFTNIFTSSDISDAIGGVVSLIGDLANIILDIINDVLPSFQTALLILKDAFNSNGFRKGVQAARDIFKSFSDIVGNVAKVVLPLAAEVIGLVAEHLDILVPLAETAVVAFSAWKIISSVVKWGKTLSATLTALTAKVVTQSSAEVVAALQTGGATTAMTLQQIAAGVLTGKITIATAATWLWNAAQGALNAVMSANPIGVVVTAIAALATAILWITNLVMQANDRTEEYNSAIAEMEESQQKAEESANNLGSAFENVSEYANDFHEGIQNAKSVLDGIDDSIIMNTEKFDGLTEKMETVQSQFTNIAGTYSDERKQLTKDEISELEDLLKQMQELADQQLEMLKGYQNVAQTKTERFVENFSGTAEEFAEESKSYIKAAEEAKDKVIAAADEQYEAALLNIDRMTGLSASERKRLEDEAEKQHDAAVEAAEKERDDTLAIVIDRYNQLDETHIEYNQKIAKLNDDLYNADVELQKKIQENGQKYINDQEQLKINLAKIHDEYNLKISEIMDDFTNNFDEESQEQIGIWLQMVEETQSSSGEIEESTALMCVNMLEELEDLPPEAKAAMQDTIDKLHEVVDKLPEDMRNKANIVVGSFSNTLSSDANKEKVETAAKELMNATLPSMDDAIKKAAEYGSDFSSGYAIGIKRGTGNVAVAAVGMALEAGLGVKTTQKSNSPSKVTRELGNYFTQGYMLGITDDEDKLLNAVTNLSQNAIQSIGKGIGDSVMTARVALDANTDSFIGNIQSKLANSQLIARLKSAVAVETSGISMTMTGRNMSNYTNTDGNSSGTIKASGNIETHISINGREFAVVTAPYLDEELAFTKG